MPVTLARVVRRGLATGEPLPDVYPTLAKAKIHLRRATLAMVAGMPGSMKTVFGLNLSMEMGVPTLYFSNDSDESTVAERLLARTQRTSTETAGRQLFTDPAAAAKVLASVDHIRWCFNPCPSLKDLEEELAAFCEVYGEYPHLVVVDILLKIDHVESSEHSSLSRVMAYLDYLARYTEACFLIMHHTSESYPGNPCQPRAAIMQKVNQLPVLQLTVAHANGVFYVAAVKNRYGPDDHTGRTTLRFSVDAPTCTISEYTYTPTAYQNTEDDDDDDDDEWWNR